MADVGRPQRALALDAFESLHEALEASDYCGWEFDDFLASPIVRRLCVDRLLLQRIAVQVGERSPVNLRAVLRVPKLGSTKADGFFARGYLHAYVATGDDRWLKSAIERLASLPDRSASGIPGTGWGNDFDFASRAGLFRKGVPTVVWSAHIGEAFADAHRLTGDIGYARQVVDVGDFVLGGLERHEDESGVCLAYAPGLLPLVHNSNLLGGVSLLRAWAYDATSEKFDLARKSFGWSLSRMREDGAWFYGVGKKYEWIDNFHTAYVIDCLLEASSLCGEEIVPSASLHRAVNYWLETFFCQDGAPKYYHDRLHPLDIQCAAQAIETLSKLESVFPGALSQAASVLRWTLNTFRRDDGFFGYRRYRRYEVPLVSLHWGQATMLSALGRFLAAVSEPA